MLTSVAPPSATSEAVSHRNTAVLVVFTALTNLADGVTKVALPLMATALTHSPARISGVSLTLTLPWLLVALHVGVLVDRFDRRTLLWLANAARMAAMALLIALLPSGRVTLPVLYASGLTLGLAEVVALTSAAGTAIALGAVAVGYFGGGVALFFLIGRFRVAHAPHGRPPPVRLQIAEGLGCLWHQPLLRLMAVALTVLCMCWGAWLALMPLFATTVLGLDSRGYGVTVSALGVGGFVGALSVTLLNRRFGRRTVMLTDLLGTFAMMAVPVLSTNLWAVAASAFAGGLGGTLWTVNARTISQHLVPGPLLGRYNAAARLFSWGAMPIGAGFAGAIAELLGMRAAFAALAVAALLLIVPFLRVASAQALRIGPERRH